MVPVTSPVPDAAWETLRTMACIAAPCSSTAAAIEVATSLICSICAVIPPIATAAWPLVSWIAAICPVISSVARAVWPASSFTSAATTAKPRPAAPARAASIVALSASRLVWAAIEEINPTTSPIRAVASVSART